MHLAFWRAYATLGCILLPGAAWAQPNPRDGTEFQANSYTPDRQRSPVVAAGSEGQFVIAWESAGSFGGDDSVYSVQARRVDMSAGALGTQEFQVNTSTGGSQAEAAAAVAASGEFVVAWCNRWQAPGDDYESVQFRRFDSSGASLDLEDVQANSYTTEYQRRPSVALASSGEFVVAWESYGSFGNDDSGTSIQVRRFRADGSPLGARELQVNTYTWGFERHARVAADAAGNFVVAWDSDRLPTGEESWNIWARRFRADGTPIDAHEFQVSTYPAGYRRLGRLALDPNGGFVVVWGSQGSFDSDSDSYSVQARRYDPAGVALDATEFQVNTYTTGFQYRPGIGMDSEGGFLIVWTGRGSAGTDHDNTSVQGRRFRPNGTPIDLVDVQLNEVTTGGQYVDSVGALPDGDFLVAWSSTFSQGTDTDGLSIQARRFGRPTVAVTSTSGGTGGPGCTLRDAISAANLGQPVGECAAGNEGAVIELPAGATIALTGPDNGSNGLPVVERSVTIAGHGARVVRDEALECPGSPELRLFDVADGGILALEDLTVANGCLAAETGGGIRSSGGSVMLRRTLVEGNEAWAAGGGLAVNGGNLVLLDATIRANLSGGPGGGISVTGSPGLVRIYRSTLAGNLAASGGGLALDGTARAWVRNTTLSGNAATAGGGMALAGETPAVVLEFSTVTENAAASGAGIALDAGSLALHGSLVGDNAAGADCAATVGVASASGLSLDTDGSCAALVGSGVTTAASFALGPLGENGGWTETHLPLATSPALDAAPACATRSAAPLFDDQRAMPRPSDDDGDGDAECDLGAVERGPVFVDGFESGGAGRWSLATP